MCLYACVFNWFNGPVKKCNDALVENHCSKFSKPTSPLIIHMLRSFSLLKVKQKEDFCATAITNENALRQI